MTELHPPICSSERPLISFTVCLLPPASTVSPSLGRGDGVDVGLGIAVESVVGVGVGVAVGSGVGAGMGVGVGQPGGAGVGKSSVRRLILPTSTQPPRSFLSLSPW